MIYKYMSTIIVEGRICIRGYSLSVVTKETEPQEGSETARASTSEVLQYTSALRTALGAGGYCSGERLDSVNFFCILL